MRSRVLSALVAPVMVIGMVAALAQPAFAQGSIDVVEGSSFKTSQTITVHYKGFGLYERFFVQQCWEGPSPTFDFATSCAVDSMVFPGLLDRDDGTLKFQLFVGDEPSGDFGVSCGPKTKPGNVQHDTCWIRAVTYDRAANDRAVFFPITFDGATPVAAGTTTVATTVPPKEASTTVAAAAAAAAAAGPSTTAPAPRLTVTVHGGTTHKVIWRDLAGIGGGVAVGVAGVVVMSRRRRRAPATPS